MSLQNWQFFSWLRQFYTDNIEAGSIMTIRLTPSIEEFIDEQVRAGKFASADEAVEAAVNQMREREEKIAWLRREIQLGVDQLERGEGAEWNIEELETRLRDKYPTAYPAKESA
jgi:antitoxin ParD1/3/4